MAPKAAASGESSDYGKGTTDTASPGLELGSRREAIAKTKGEIDDLIRYLDKCSELVTPRRGVYKMLHFSRYDLRKAMESFRKKASNLTELQALTGLFEDKIERPLKETLEEEMHAMHAMHALDAASALKRWFNKCC